MCVTQDGLKTPITGERSLLVTARHADNAMRHTVRFSTVGGESGSADTARDPRGFAVK